jgi:hypothetical protein
MMKNNSPLTKSILVFDASDPNRCPHLHAVPQIYHKQAFSEKKETLNMLYPNLHKSPALKKT